MSDEPLRWYHGTRRGFTRGGLLIPASRHGGERTTAPLTEGATPQTGAENWVYMTTNIDLAWAYAFHASGRGKPKVLVLHPVSMPEPDPEHSSAMAAYRCEAATVTDVLTEPTITEAEARSGWATT